MKVTLIRHTSVDVPEGICYGQTDVPLKDSFETEAAIVASTIHSEAFDKVYTSPLSRCIRLADYCGYPDAERDDRIKEIHFGEWEMQLFSEIKDARLEEWYADYIHIPAPEGESFMMQYDRVSNFLDSLKSYDYQHVAVFAHGGVLICAQVYAGTVDLHDAFRVLPPYGGIISIEI